MTYTSRFGNLTVVDEPVYKSELYEAPASNLNSILTASTQFGKTLGANVPLITGGVANGCTFFDPVADKDADGVINAIDQCPDTPAGAAVDANGCWTMDTDSLIAPAPLFDSLVI